MFTACADLRLVPCEGGFECPRGTECDLINRRCLTPEQVTACVDQPEGSDCIFSDINGICHLGACVQSTCGNEVVEPGEACDDGNRTDKDGCRSDCRSDESCGNGILDFQADEPCDDNNDLSHDGCSNALFVCTAEVPTWKQLVTAAWPSHRRSHAMAYQAELGRMVLFGGALTAGGGSDETWFLQDDTWVKMDPPPTPRPQKRSGHAMAYDAAGKRIVLFGGHNEELGTGEFNDTWFFQGDVWVPGPPAPAELVPRANAAMAYDAAGKRIVLFGGLDGSAAFRKDTWFLKGETWEQGPDAPMAMAARYGHKMTDDVAQGRVVLFGGIRENGMPPQGKDTWLLEGDTWVEGPAAPSALAPRAFHALVYDAALGHVVLFGGSGVNGQKFNDTWVLAEDSWILVALPGDLLPRNEHAMGYDAAAAKTIVFGGAHQFAVSNETWSFRYEAEGTPDENCSLHVDADGDGQPGCEDPDCWGVCTPYCPPRSGEACEPAPGCGDTLCNAALENCDNCPSDCPCFSAG
jgi:cysteine-rich repeat protein